MSDEATCKGGLQVEAKPFTEEEMERNRDYANGDLAEEGAPSNEPRPGAYLILRYHATLREQRVEYDKLENAMNEVSIWSKEVEAERDAYKAVADAYMGEWGGPRAKAENIRYWIRVLDMANEAEEMARALAWEALADHLEA